MPSLHNYRCPHCIHFARKDRLAVDIPLKTRSTRHPDKRLQSCKTAHHRREFLLTWNHRPHTRRSSGRKLQQRKHHRAHYSRGAHPARSPRPNKHRRAYTRNRHHKASHPVLVPYANTNPFHRRLRPCRLHPSANTVCRPALDRYGCTRRQPHNGRLCIHLREQRSRHRRSRYIRTVLRSMMCIPPHGRVSHIHRRLLGFHHHSPRSLQRARPRKRPTRGPGLRERNPRQKAAREAIEQWARQAPIESSRKKNAVGS